MNELTWAFKLGIFCSSLCPFSKTKENKGTDCILPDVAGSNMPSWSDSRVSYPSFFSGFSLRKQGERYYCISEQERASLLSFYLLPDIIAEFRLSFSAPPTISLNPFSKSSHWIILSSPPFDLISSVCVWSVCQGRAQAIHNRRCEKHFFFFNTQEGGSEGPGWSWLAGWLAGPRTLSVTEQKVWSCTVSSSVAFST